MADAAAGTIGYEETTRPSMDDHSRRQSILRAILAFSILSTGIHYTHNFVEVDQYPRADYISGTAIQVAILVSWPLLTAIGLYGYRLYSQRRYRVAHGCLVTSSFAGLITPGHFLNGSPEIPALFYATIFTDGLAGLAMLAFVAWSARAVRAREAGAPA